MSRLVPRSSWLADLTWPEVATLAADGAILAVPVGSTEQHGPHLPLSTDTDVAVAICRRIAELWANVVIAPPLNYGSSGEHAAFAGTISIGQEATELVLVEYGRSASETFDHILFVSAHGGNATPVGRAVDRLVSEGRDAAVFEPRWHGELHAGAIETAMQLSLTPHRVLMDRAAAGNTAALEAIMPMLTSGGVREVSENGVLGDPRSATASQGAALLTELVQQADVFIARWARQVSR
jgi:mycofactocin precursor peptide peptidase